MTSDPHTILILQTIMKVSNGSGAAWWVDVSPALEPYGLDFNNVSPLRDRGLIERSREIGLLRLTPAGRAKIS